MNEFSHDDVKFAAAILAVRATRARQSGGLSKTANWTEQIKTFVNNLKNPGVDITQNFADDPTGGKYWKNVGMESLRNALIGAGIGGVGGAASSALSGRRHKQPWNRALRGAVIGGTLGGFGTGAFRGAQSIFSQAPATAAEELAQKEQALARQKSVARAQGHVLPGEQAPKNMLQEGIQTAKGVASGLASAEDEGLAGAAKNMATAVAGKPGETTVTDYPVGAVGGAAIGAGLVPGYQVASDRLMLGRALGTAERAGVAGMPSRLERIRGPWRGLGSQFRDVDKLTAENAIEAMRKGRGLPSRGYSNVVPTGARGKALAGILAIAGGYLGGLYDKALARQMYGNRTWQPPTQGQ